MAEETNKIILGKNQFATIVNNPDETDQATTVTITTKKRKINVEVDPPLKLLKQYIQRMIMVILKIQMETFWLVMKG